METHPWKIIENTFDPSRVRANESILSIGNGRMGMRANFEEQYSGDTLQGSYVGGVYYPDKTRVGWWKNGYPENFAKVLNSAFWAGVNVTIDGKNLDLAQAQKVENFHWELDMKQGVLRRSFVAHIADNQRVRVEAERFVSLARHELGVVKYSITLLDKPASVTLDSYIDADVHNEDSNYGEKFWELAWRDDNEVVMHTKKSDFVVCWAMRSFLSRDANFMINSDLVERVSHRFDLELPANQTVILYKYVAVVSSLNHAHHELCHAAQHVLNGACTAMYDTLLREQEQAWGRKWEHADIEIEGDTAAQQGIRFCIFQLLQTYTGDDTRLNIGPKGFTGEKYGGSTYWDTEAYCLPFYLSVAGAKVARSLLLYRYNQLEKAIENGTKLGFTGGAALYPMVTMDGSECHNEWEITFEEIHRNGAIAYAIFNYVRYTQDHTYLAEQGCEVLLAIARFWSQRITYSTERAKYVMLGVTGPNEYENNVNNNFYTNYLALWCMSYAGEVLDDLKINEPEHYQRIVQKTNFQEDVERPLWWSIIDNMHLPYSPELDVFLQQDGYLDKEQILARDLDPAQRPLNQKWSWDRILRSCFIKQADVLQALYFFEDDFDIEDIERNFHFYEQRTVHESSLSPCVHAILACKIDDMDKAYQMYLRAARLDLDDYNKENAEGLHITSMAGSWLSIVQGYGGMRVSRNGELSFDPKLPQGWQKLSFKVDFRGSIISLEVTPDEVYITMEQGEEPLEVTISGQPVELLPPLPDKNPLPSDEL